MEIVVKKIVRNGGGPPPPNQRGFTDIMTRISAESLDMTMSNVVRECRRCELIVLQGGEGESDVSCDSYPEELGVRGWPIAYETRMSVREHGDKE